MFADIRVYSICSFRAISLRKMMFDGQIIYLLIRDKKIKTIDLRNWSKHIHCTNTHQVNKLKMFQSSNYKLN